MLTGMWEAPRVEPLSRAAWQRIEARVFASLGGRDRSGTYPVAVPLIRPRRTRVLAGTLVFATGALLYWGVGAGGLNARAPSPEKAARASPTSETLVEASAAARGSPAGGRRVATTTAPADVALGDSVLTIAAHSLVELGGDERRGWLVQLHAGEVDCQVAARLDRPPFVVRAGATSLTAVGSRFEVARSGAGASVFVQHGVVRVEQDGREARLQAGDRWPPADGPRAGGAARATRVARARRDLERYLRRHARGGAHAAEARGLSRRARAAR